MELDDGPQSIVDVFYAANRDTRLAPLFTQNITNFISAGGKDFFYFLNEDLWTNQGAFGARQYQDQTREQSPIFDGLSDYIEGTPCSWTNCELSTP